MTDAKVNKLRTKRTVLVEQQNRVAEFVDVKAKNATMPELSLRLNSLIKMFESFATVQSELESLVKDETSNPDRANYEETYFKIRPMLQVRINAIEADTRGAQVQPEFKSNIKLPKIEINSFAGDYTKWLEFYESFISLIHNNPSLNNVTKFQYLRNALSGDAARVIAALELSNENYDTALKLLRDRYQNVKLICNAHIFEIFSIKNIERGNAVKIRNVIDIVNTHLRSLKSLGRPTLQWDDLIIFFILSKLDHDTRMKWEDECSMDKMPTLDQLLIFLERRCRALENNDQINKQNHQYQSGSKPFSKNITLNKQKYTSLVAVHSEKCIICDKPGHGVYRCAVFLSKPVTERLLLVSKYNLCANCLTSNHNNSQCQSKFKCRICFKIHHTLLHTEESTTSSNVQKSTSQSIKNMLPSSSKHLNEPQFTGSTLLVKGISSYVFLMTATTNQDEMTRLNNIVQQFWNLEQINNKAACFTNEEQICETHFLENVSRADSGRFTVAFPFLHSPKLLGNSRQGALIRFLNLEKRLCGNPELKSQYSQFIEDYRNLNHMRLESESNIPDSHYFLPHHCVLKPSSSTTKLRVVFDASAKTDYNKSLNELLMVGPVVQSDLLSILLRFRRWKIAFSADISKMYRQINICENDSHYQYIFWRDNPEDELQTYRLTTVTYGTASAPYLATRCLLQLCNEEAKSHPLASKVVQSDMYVDDLLTGSNSINEAMYLQREVVSLLATAEMNLKKWCSNSVELLSHIPDADKESFHVLNNENVIKTLGTFWQPEKDYFCYMVKVLPNPKRITKRLVLSETASIFDPLGLAGPVILVAKIFIQQIWKLKQDWDESLPQSMHTKWSDFKNQLTYLNNFRVKRFIETYELTTDVQLYGSEGYSSEVAFGAAIYIRCNNHNNITTTLLCAKSRVAPLSKVTLLRLELCAALLTAQLISKVRSHLNVKVNKMFYWTDSSIVWHWIKSTSSHSKAFVANRIAEIHRLSNIEEWNHVASENNAADVISRGLMPAQLINCSLWLNGPDYLRQPVCKWPKSLLDPCPVLPEQLKVVCLLTTEKEDVLLNHKYIQQFKSLQRSMAYVCRFASNCRKPIEERRLGELVVEELAEGHNLIIKSIQYQHFQSDLISLSNQQNISKNSHLKTLNPFIDKDGLLRVGGRLKNSELPYTSKFPLILPLNHKATLTIFNHYHYSYLHPGPQALLAMIKEKYWAIGGRKIARKAIHLELVSDVSTNSFIGALKRFIATRGRCTTIFTDNATNFVGANQELRKIFDQVNKSQINRYCVDEGITWKFAPPRSPHFGGLYEAAVKTTKHHIRRIFGNAALTHEEFLTAIKQIEAVVNSRPLTALSTNPDDLNAITPGHFLIGRQMMNLPEININENIPTTKRWQIVQQLFQHFWKRWSVEYLTELQQRRCWDKKSKNLEIGQLVLLKEDDLPPLKWKLGRIVTTHAGNDGYVRVVTVKISTEECKRAVVKVCPLPEPLFET